MVEVVVVIVVVEAVEVGVVAEKAVMEEAAEVGVVVEKAVTEEAVEVEVVQKLEIHCGRSKSVYFCKKVVYRNGGNSKMDDSRSAMAQTAA